MKLAQDFDSHILEKISQALVVNHPTPHCVVTDLLPGDIYQKVIAEWPSFQKVKSLKLQNYSYSGRRLMRLSEEPYGVVSLRYLPGFLW